MPPTRWATVMNSTNSARKRRAPAACTACHARKVRCNVVSIGAPCSNCQLDETECILHVSARGKHKGSRQKQREQDASSSVPAVTPLPTPSSSATEEFESNVAGYKNIVEAHPEFHEGGTHIYVGETQGLRFVFNAVKGNKIASCAHCIVPPANVAKLAPEDLAYLQAKDAFNIESDRVRSELIDRYFDYVHPILPVIDPYDFFFKYEHNGPSGIPPLLLQSMFLAASSYISQDGLRSSGASSIKSLKKRFYLRAKALYDCNQHSEQTALIQSLLLMGYWYGNTHDRADSWHWIGIAISLSQSFGFHRDPGQSSISQAQRRLWRRIWWCCFYRDRYIALGMGRPIRINLADCDIQDLTIEDLVYCPTLSALSREAAAIVEKSQKLSGNAIIFLEMLNLCKILGRVLVNQYCPQQSLGDPDGLETELKSWWTRTNTSYPIEPNLHGHIDDSQKSEVVYKHFLQMTYHVTSIVLLRPLVMTRETNEHHAHYAWGKCQSSALAAMDLIKALVEYDLIDYLPPEIVTLLLTIISILFLDRLWAKGLKRRLATHQLDLAMLTLRELEKKYLAASFVIAYYTAAFQKILQEATQGSFRIAHPPWADLSDRHLENFELDFTTADTTWASQWVSENSDLYNVSDTNIPADWPSPELTSPYPEFFWDSIMGPDIGLNLMSGTSVAEGSVDNRATMQPSPNFGPLNNLAN